MTTPTTMKERFEEKKKDFMAVKMGDWWATDEDSIFSFIQSEIDLAVEKREKEVFEWAKIKVDSFFKELLNNK